MSNSLLLKSLLGAFLVAIIVTANKLLGPQAAAIVSWFPVFTILGLVFIHQAEQTHKSAAVQKFLIGGLWSLLLLALFSGIVYALVTVMSAALAVTVAILVWFIIASAFVAITSDRKRQ